MQQVKKTKKWGFVVLETPMQSCFVLEVEYIGKRGSDNDIIVRGANDEIIQVTNFYANREEALNVAMRRNGSLVEHFQNEIKLFESKLEKIEKQVSNISGRLYILEHKPTGEGFVDKIIYLLKGR